MPNIKYKKQFPLTDISRIHNLFSRNIGFCKSVPDAYAEDITEKLSLRREQNRPFSHIINVTLVLNLVF